MDDRHIDDIRNMHWKIREKTKTEGRRKDMGRKWDVIWMKSGS